MTAAVRTTCPYCGVGCGLLASCDGAGKPRLRPDPEHPANLGRICSKGAALGETLDLGGRLLHPEIGGRRAGWDTALDYVAQVLGDTIRRHGPDSVAFYVSGQLLTEDYYVANKLMKGFIGSANIDTNSRLCMSSSVAGHKRAFGADTVPGCYEDLEEADLVVLVGSNAAWCHPVLYQRLQKARAARGTRVVVVDPRATATSRGADLHLALRPGTDVALFNGLFLNLFETANVNQGFVIDHTRGIEAAMDTATRGPATAGDVAEACDLDPTDVERFYALFRETERAVTLYSQGVNQSSAGTDKVNAIINCHLATGRIGRPGMGPFSLTGQPNAMGGREVGGLANQLAAHMDIDNPDHRLLVRDFWDSPTICEKPGLKAVELFEAIERGTVKAVWIMSTNPVVSMPDAERVRAALSACPSVIVSECMARTDTTAVADVLLPALAWGEKSGTVTNSERRISRQRAFLDAPGEARADWWIVAEAAKRMGFAQSFNFATAADVFREHAALSGFRNGGTRDFDISGLAGISDSGYDALTPLRWPVRPETGAETPRLFGDGRFCFDDGRARFVPVTQRAPVHATDEQYPLILNTGRVRDHWHTMTRTGKAPSLSAHVDEPFVAVHPRDAARFRLEEDGFARVTSRWGAMLARVRVETGQVPGSVFVPMHWSGRFAANARVGAVVNPAVDPVSGQPELKYTPVAVAPLAMTWQAMAMSRRALDPGDVTCWSRARGRGLWRYRLAGTASTEDGDAWARRLLGDDDGAEWVSYRDAAAGCYRYARLADGRLDACLFVARGGLERDFGWLEPLFAADSLSAEERAGLLSGRPPSGAASMGPVVCSCFSVGRDQIAAAIEKGGITSVEEIGNVLGAGTNCGSCKPELHDLLSGKTGWKAVAGVEST